MSTESWETGDPRPVESEPMGRVESLLEAMGLLEAAAIEYAADMSRDNATALRRAAREFANEAELVDELQVDP